MYKQHDYETCSNILVYLLVMSRCLEYFVPMTAPNVNNPIIIRQCLEINMLYKTIQNCPRQTPVTKGKKLAPQFFDDPRNQEYVKLIHNHDLLKSKTITSDEILDIQSSGGGNGNGGGGNDGRSGSGSESGIGNDHDNDITVVLCE